MFYFNEFFAWLMTKYNYAKATFKSYLKVLKAFRLYCLSAGIKSVEVVTEKTAGGYIEYLHRKDTSESYRYTSLYIIRKYFRFLYEKGFVFSSPFESYRFPSFHRNHYPVIPQGEIERILNNLKDESPTCRKGKAVLELMYSSALRPAEVCRLTVPEIDFREKQLFIKQAKGKKDRIVPVSQVALEALADYINTIRKDYLKPNSPDNVFLGLCTGKPDNSTTLRKTINRTLEKSGFKPIKPYSMRATSATVLFLNGMSMAYVSKLLGHSGYDTTRVYLRVNFKELKKEYEKRHPRSRSVEKGEKQ